MAVEILSSGRAYAKFMAICEAQGGFTEPPSASLRHDIVAAASGVVDAIDNRDLARIAKLAGAPSAKAAGVDLHVKLGQPVIKGEPLFTVHAETRGELDYALAFANANPATIKVRPQ
jgi:thymidine phosphorylase